MDFLADALSYLAVIAAFWWWKAAATPAASGTLAIAVLATLATIKHQAVAALALALAGAAWIAVLTTANATAQANLPNWVRGRGPAIYLTVFYGAMTLGSFVWGQAADGLGVPAALLAAAGVGVASLFIGWRKPLPQSEPDVAPSIHWPEPGSTLDIAASLAQERGPLLITVEYRIDPARRAEFLALLSDFAHERFRDGAYQWGVFQDMADAAHFVEHFLVPSWQEHRRQHRRVTRDDADLQDRIRRFHLGPGAPVVQHLIYPGADCWLATRGD